MEDYIRSLDMKSIAATKMDEESFIEAYNKNEAVLLDVRYPFELNVWKLTFSLDIPLNELPDSLDKLPKEKLIVCACPEVYRSNIASQYLLSKGYRAKTLSCGMLKLMDRLKGGKANELKL
jgi:rhodanese-related sulfurtransferase